MTFPFSSSHISTTIGETTLIMYVTWPDTFKIVSFQYVFSVISPDFLISYPFLSFQSLKNNMVFLQMEFHNAISMKIYKSENRNT